jgi:hypothetical protein
MIYSTDLDSAVQRSSDEAFTRTSESNFTVIHSLRSGTLSRGPAMVQLGGQTEGLETYLPELGRSPIFVADQALASLPIVST